MGETLKVGQDGGVPGKPTKEETPVARTYIGDLVRDYLVHHDRSGMLMQLFAIGLPSEARSGQPRSEINPKQDLRDVLFSLLEIYNFWGEIPTRKSTSDRSSAYQPFYQHQGLPHLNLIKLQHTLPNNDNPTIRFKKNEDGSIVVRGFEIGDIGERGFPPEFYVAAEYLMVNYDGGLKLGAKYFPGKDQNGPERRYFKDHPLYPNSLLVLKSLVTIALNGAKLQEEGQLFYANGEKNNGRYRPKDRPKIFT